VLHLECDAASFREYLRSLENNPKEYEYTARHGLRWSVVVQARSSLKFEARVEQKETELGAPMRLRGRLTEYGLAVEGRAQVAAELRSPRGETTTIGLEEGPGGVFAGEVKGTEYGVYRYRMMAAGRTLRGSRFTRERSLTGSIYIPRPPEDPRPPQG
jgi:hypothetical protein